MCDFVWCMCCGIGWCVWCGVVWWDGVRCLLCPLWGKPQGCISILERLFSSFPVYDLWLCLLVQIDICIDALIMASACVVHMHQCVLEFEVAYRWMNRSSANMSSRIVQCVVVWRGVAWRGMAWRMAAVMSLDAAGPPLDGEFSLDLVTHHFERQCESVITGNPQVMDVQDMLRNLRLHEVVLRILETWPDSDPEVSVNDVSPPLYTFLTAFCQCNPKNQAALYSDNSLHLFAQQLPENVV